MFKRRWGKKRTLGIALTCLMLLLACACLPRLLLRRPLFYHWCGFGERIIPWEPNAILSDRSGNIAYIDPETNMCVIVLTRDLNYSGAVIPRSRPDSARLLPESPHEVTIEEQDNTAVIVISHNDRVAFSLPNGFVKAWQEEHFESSDSSNCDTLLIALARRFQGSQRTDALQVYRLHNLVNEEEIKCLIAQ
jgi:hypothetical protein